jgi:hypothetical protein
MAAMGTPLAAVQMADGTVYFERPPSLVGATTTRSDVYASRPRYYFTLDVPTDAGEPLQQISISQRTNYGVLGDVLEDLEDVEAFLGTRRDRGDAIAIRDVAVDEENQSVTVTLETPVAPGNAVTLALRPERNPRRGGVYLFGVTAFPSGEKAQGQFLGYGRLHFYERNNNPFRFNLF